MLHVAMEKNFMFTTARRNSAISKGKPKLRCLASVTPLHLFLMVNFYGESRLFPCCSLSRLAFSFV
jgi:hypothetical protein